MSKEKRDYYEVLGIDRNSTADDIKKAFRNMAKKYHPDLHPNDKQAEEKFKEINEAYEVLSDPNKKERYDQFGFAGVDPAHGFDASGASGQGFGFDSIFDDFIGSFMGGSPFGGGRGGGRRAQQRRGSDKEMDLVLDFEEAVFGVEKDISVKRRIPCGDCNGTGAEPGTKPEKCPTCNGQGKVMRVSQMGGFRFQQVTDCETCRGRGQITRKKCSKCKGTGIVTDIDNIHVPIPPGFPDEGVVIPIRGRGDMEEDGSIPGDLYLNVTVKKHPIFKRDGKHLIRELSVDYLQLLLGDEIPVMTLEGTQAKLKIPPGTKTGETLRIEGKGAPIFRDDKGRRGDLYLTVNCEIPKFKELSAEERTIVEELAKKRLDKIHERFAKQEEEIKTMQDKKNRKDKKKQGDS
nr:molecular chaperone DnaJ [Candidatus Sigynarchaeota archaeon]